MLTYSLVAQVQTDAKTFGAQRGGVPHKQTGYFRWPLQTKAASSLALLLDGCTKGKRRVLSYDCVESRKTKIADRHLGTCHKALDVVIVSSAEAAGVIGPGDFGSLARSKHSDGYFIAGLQVGAQVLDLEALGLSYTEVD
jgi:hypothetical protein